LFASGWSGGRRSSRHEADGRAGGTSLYSALAVTAGGMQATILTGVTAPDALAVGRLVSGTGVDLIDRRVAVPCRFHLSHYDSDER